MKEPPTTYKNLEKALADKHERIHHPARYKLMQLRKERKAKGLCTLCGIKKMTKSQKKGRLVACYQCRQKKRLQCRQKKRLVWDESNWEQGG